MDSREMVWMLVRYLVLVLIPLGGLTLLYLIFTPLTVYPVYWILKMIYSDTILLGTTTLYFHGQFASIVAACVGGAAYYLLLILNLTTPMTPSKRVKSICFIAFIFLLLNVIRITIFAILLATGYNYFDITHQMTWYFGSTVLVILVWFTNVLVWDIRAIPIYSDIVSVIRDVRGIKSTGAEKNKPGIANV